MLPHGYDGQGPEHSSARIERFLQLCARNNMRVCNCTTPAQLFHLLRRQAKQKKKPLILFTHKSLLRAEDAASTVSELVHGEFKRVIADELAGGKKALDRLIFVSGKVYWDLVRYCEAEKIDKNRFRLVRIEELYPFPEEDVMRIVSERSAKEIVWLQEEPRNNGAFLYMRDKFNSLGLDVRYIGRMESASPSTGSQKIHKMEQASIMEHAFMPFDKARSLNEVTV